ncbi:MAG: Ldh family oxidoreductase [Micrococcaceae bacterium]
MVTTTTRTVGIEELRQLCVAAAQAVGARAAQARALADATVEAERRGRSLVGLHHLTDYLAAWRAGRLSTETVPEVREVSSSLSVVECHGGLAQEGFAVVREQLVAAARSQGVAVTMLRGHFPAGELGHYVRMLAESGLMSVVCGNSPAAMAAAGARKAIFGTNPLAFGLPDAHGRVLLSDQSTSATAWVGLREAAEAGEALAPGTAVDDQGTETLDAVAGMAGSLLPFGGYKGGNIAFLVELLATLGGGLFSTETPRFESGDEPPQLGLFVLAVDPERSAPGYAQRLTTALESWRDDHGAAIARWYDREARDSVEVPEDVLAELTGGTR